MTFHALLFEANAIQSWIAGSGRLRELVGGSELLDLICNESDARNLLDRVAQACGANGRIVFSRRSGGAFYAFCEDAAVLEAFADLWSLAVQQWAPGLSFSLGRGAGGTQLDAFEQARRALVAAHARPTPLLPAGAPVAARNRRTGQVAESLDRKDGPVERAVIRKRAFADPARAGFIERFSPEGLNWRDWPRHFEPGEDGAMPFLSEQRTVALIHADGNAMGQILLRLAAAARGRPASFMALYQGFSRTLDESTRLAARVAASTVLVPARRHAGEPLAARPILLGGDDVTVLVRADLAMDYVLAFAHAYEQHSARLLQEHVAGLGVEHLPQRLTLGFGLVYMSASQPFAMASTLGESLMRQAKALAKQQCGESVMPASSIAFHRVTSALVESLDAVRDNEWTVHGDGSRFVTRLDGYFLEAAGQPALADLLALQRLLDAEDMARGPTRQLLTLLGLSTPDARTRYRRWRQLMGEHRPQRLEQFDALLTRLLGAPAEVDLPFGPADAAGVRRSPLGDVLALRGAGHAVAGAGAPSAGEAAA